MAFPKKQAERVFGLKVPCRELDIFKILGFFLEIVWIFFWISWEIFGNFFGGFFLEDFFWRNFFGGFLGGIFWEELLGRFLQGIGFCQDLGVILSRWKEEEGRILDP